jgi:hypothetical protein
MVFSDWAERETEIRKITMVEKYLMFKYVLIERGSYGKIQIHSL